MPKSRREKLVSLTRTERKTRSHKEALVNDIRECVDSYAYLYVFSVENMRNAYLKVVRTEWRDSRFFMGSNRVMSVALGTTEESEHRPNLRLIAERLSGSVGLFFTNRTTDAVTAFFDEYSPIDYARAGNVASQTIILDEGSVKMADDDELVPHPLEPQLRKLGMPTVLKNGVVSLKGQHTLCTEGHPITPEQAHVLKLLHYKLAHFKVIFLCYWTKDTYTELVTPEEQAARQLGQSSGDGGADEADDDSAM